MNQSVYDIAEATWPPARSWDLGPWRIRDGAGGGKRVSAATLEGALAGADIAAAEHAMTQLGQDPLFMIRSDNQELDAALADRGYQVVDPVWVYATEITEIAAHPLPHGTAMASWPPLAIQKEIWSAGGIGPQRIAVMERTGGPRAAILGRTNDQPAGTGFVAIHQNVAMIHAIEVKPALRRHGVGTNILRCAARWAQNQGAQRLALLVTKANAGANTLYASLGFEVVEHYQYRIKRNDTANRSSNDTL